MRVSSLCAALAAPLILVFFIGMAVEAEAGGKCNPVFQTCKQVLKSKVNAQMRAACDRYGREQEANENRCRSYDVRSGKSLEQCAECCVLLRFDREHWRQCAALGLAPPVPEGNLAASERRLCAD